MITFTAGDMRDPERELPKAMYVALGVTTLLYVLISIGVFGTLTVDEIIATARPRSPRRRGPRSATPASR